MDKMYVVVRADLPPGAQVAQACHGLRAFVEAYPEVDRKWYDESNNLVVLQVADEDELVALRERARGAGVLVTAFREPDEDDTMTALAMEPAARRLVSNLPLALRPTSP